MRDRSRIRLLADDGRAEASDAATANRLAQRRDDTTHLDWTAPHAGRPASWRARMLLAACTAGGWLRCLFTHLSRFARRRGR